MKTVSNNNEFRLHLPGRLSYIFYAPSSEDRDSWVKDIIKSINAEHIGDPKKKQEEKEKEKEKEEEKEEKDEKQKTEIVINEDKESSDEERQFSKTPVDKSRSKMNNNNRVKSEVVSTSTRVRKSAVLPPTNFDTPPETGNLLGFDPFAPSLSTTSSPPTKNNNPVNKVKNTPKRTKISSSPVHPGMNSTTPYPFQSTLTPIPYNTAINQYNPGYSPFNPQVIPNPYANPQLISQPNTQTLVTTPQVAPNPFTFPVQPQVQNPQPFYNPSAVQPQFTGQATLQNSNPFMMQPNSNTYMGVGGFQSTTHNPQGNIFFGEVFKMFGLKLSFML
jgi:hypothetical protein